MDQELLQTLAGTQSSDEATRRGGEERLKVILAMPARLRSRSWLLYLAGILLEKYIKQYWSAIFDGFIGPMTPLEIKHEIRTTLLSGLSSPHRRIRTTSAFSLSTIAHSDWPDDFPTLLPSLQALLVAGHPDGIHGAMRVLSEFVRQDLGEEQMMGMMRGMLPVLLGVAQNEQNPPSSRAQAISILRQCLQTLHMLKDEYPDAVNAAVTEFLPSWLDAMGVVLQKEVAQDLKGDWEGLGVRNEVFRTLITLQSAFPRALTPLFTSYLSLSIHHLLTLLPTFTLYYLSTSPSAPSPPSPASANFSREDGAGIGITDLACSIVDFLTAASRVRGAKEVLVMSGGGEGSGKGKGKGKGRAEREGPTKELEGLVEGLLILTQMTRDDEDNWTSDPNAFVADDDDETEVYSVRTASHDLLGSLFDKFSEPTAIALKQVGEKKLAESNALQSAGDADWWKPLEAALAAIGAVADNVNELIEEQEGDGVETTFEVSGLLSDVVPRLLGMGEVPFLQGRAFVFASQYARGLDRGLSTQYMEAAVRALEGVETGVPVKVSAIKTVRNFCRYIAPEILSPFSLRILSDLAPFLKEATEDTLALVLETIRAVIGVDQAVLSGAAVGQLVDVILDVWLANHEDPIIGAIVEEIFETVAGTPSNDIYNSMINRAAPKLAQIIAEPVTEETLSLPGSAIELVNSILRGKKGDIGRELGNGIWGAIIEQLLRTEDADTLVNGCVCLTLFIRKDADHLMAWQAVDGQSGLDKTLALLSRLLQPTFSEGAGLFMGDLIIHLLRNAGVHIGSVLPNLLGALVNRMAAAKASTYIQALVLPFAYLFTAHRESTLDLLEQMQIVTADGSTQSGLTIVLKAWCDDAIETIQGSWSIKVNDMAMVNLFQSERQSLQHVTVKGEMILTDANRNVIMTRAKTKSNAYKYTQIPFPVRALKWMLSQIQTYQGQSEETAKMEKGAGLDLDDDDGDDDWADDDPLAGTSKDDFGFLSDLIGGKPGWADDDEVGQQEDEDLVNDPITQINMQQHLIGVVREAYTKNTNNTHDLISGLTDTEKQVMQQVLTL